MQEELIREYINNGGKLWILESIDTYRDGGTNVIITNMNEPESRGGTIKYYIHKNNWTIHYTYPNYTLVNNVESIITDKPTLAYIMERVDKYQKDLEFKLNQINLIKENISIQGIRDRKINEILK